MSKIIIINPSADIIATKIRSTLMLLILMMKCIARVYVEKKCTIMFGERVVVISTSNISRVSNTYSIVNVNVLFI